MTGCARRGAKLAPVSLWGAAREPSVVDTGLVNTGFD